MVDSTYVVAHPNSRISHTALYRYVTDFERRRALPDHEWAFFGTQCSDSFLDVPALWAAVVGPACNLMAGKGCVGIGSSHLDMFRTQTAALSFRLCDEGEVQVLVSDFE